MIRSAVLQLCVAGVTVMISFCLFRRRRGCGFPRFRRVLEYKPKAFENLLSKRVSLVMVSLTADEVVKGCAWSDGSAEFLFGDGCVLAFRDEMNTFVALSPSHPQKDVMCTLWALSAYQSKVEAALKWYNRFSVRPCLNAMNFKPHDVPLETPPPLAHSSSAWPSTDSLYLMRDRSLLDAASVFAVTRDGDQKQLPVGTQHTLWCMLRRVSLTLHFHRHLFTVRWPCRLPSPSAAAGSTESSRVMWVEQVFPTASAPPQWQPMLHLLLDMVEEASDRVVGWNEQQPVIVPLPSSTSSSSILRFAAVEVQHRASLSAAKTLSCALCQNIIHSSPQVKPLWEMSQKPGEPHAVFWFIPPGEGASGPSPQLLAAVDEDSTLVTITQTESHNFSIHHQRLDGSQKAYVGSPGLRLPCTIGVLNFPSSDGSSGFIHAESILHLEDDRQDEKVSSQLFGERRLWAPPPSGAGRYLQSVVDSGMAILTRWGKQARSCEAPQTAAAVSKRHQSPATAASLTPPADFSGDSSFLSLPSHSTTEAACRAMPEPVTTIRVSTAGNFTAFSDGSVRCTFDDRTRLRLFPRPSVNGLTPEWEVTCLFRDATSVSIPVSCCSPHHRIHPYLSMAIAFRREVEERGASLLSGTYDVPLSIEVEAADATSPATHSLPGSTTTSVPSNEALQYCIARSTALVKENEILQAANRELLLHNTQTVERSAQIDIDIPL